MLCITHGDQLSAKPGNVREFDSCQGNVKDFTKSQGSVRKKSCREKWPKTAYLHLFLTLLNLSISF